MKPELRLLKTLFALILSVSLSCTRNNQGSESQKGMDLTTIATDAFITGADLSYLNEMTDCGAVFKGFNNQSADPWHLFKSQGMEMVRFRLWHDPQWTSYSDFDDVKKGIEKAKSLGLRVLLDFHYSDTWADPEKQFIPKAWASIVHQNEILGDSVYQYTFQTLTKLAKDSLLPDVVQIGNEINQMILQPENQHMPMDWDRNSFLINKGISAVRDISKKYNTGLEVMLHIAQPENALEWFPRALEHCITDFDWIGLSYYPLWSSYKPHNLGEALKTLQHEYSKKLMIVETAYPFTLENFDAANNILNEESLIDGYAASEDGQLQYLTDLVKILKDNGGSGLLYWEPAWVSTNCKTLWGVGSHWENAAFFKADGTPTKAFGFFE